MVLISMVAFATALKYSLQRALSHPHRLSWCRKRIVFHCDNESIVHIVRSGSSKDENIMHLVYYYFSAYLGCGYPTLLRLIWVADTQRCYGFIGLWIPNVAPAYLGCRYPTLLQFIWVVDTQRCSGLFGLWIPNVASIYPGCGCLTLLRLYWVVDTQRCSGLSGL